MEFKRIYLKYGLKFKVEELSDTINKHSYIPVDENFTNETDLEIEKLISEGWKIVSTSPVVGTDVFTERIRHTNDTRIISQAVHTIGIEVFLVK